MLGAVDISGIFDNTKPMNDKVWLVSGFRAELIKEGIEKAGSINQLGRVLGYRSRIHPGWSVRQILLGKQPFPADRLDKLAKFVGRNMKDILVHKTTQNMITLDSTERALHEVGMAYYVPLQS